MFTMLLHPINASDSIYLMVDGKITDNRLSDVAMKTKFVLPDDELVITGKNMGISFGD